MSIEAMAAQDFLARLDDGRIEGSSSARAGLAAFQAWGAANPREALGFAESAMARLPPGEEPSALLALVASMAYLGAAQACGFEPAFAFHPSQAGANAALDAEAQRLLRHKALSTPRLNLLASSKACAALGVTDDGVNRALERLLISAAQDWVASSGGLDEAAREALAQSSFRESDLPARMLSRPASYSVAQDRASALAMREAMRPWREKAEIGAQAPQPAAGAAAGTQRL